MTSAQECSDTLSRTRPPW